MGTSNDARPSCMHPVHPVTLHAPSLPHLPARSWFKFQNSWGTNFGAGGYFFTPIFYLADARLARDFWFFND